MHTQFDATNAGTDFLDAEFQAHFDGLRYGSWGTILAVIAAVATILTIVFHR